MVRERLGERELTARSVAMRIDRVAERIGGLGHNLCCAGRVLLGNSLKELAVSWLEVANMLRLEGTGCGNGRGRGRGRDGEREREAVESCRAIPVQLLDVGPGATSRLEALGLSTLGALSDLLDACDRPGLFSIVLGVERDEGERIARELRVFEVKFMEGFWGEGGRRG